MNGKWLTLAIFALALFVGLVAFYYPWIVGQKAFYQGDVTLFFEPLCRYIGDAVRHGRFPLWNPLSYCGMSQIAIPSPGLFYPFNYLFAIMSFSQALAWQMVIHQLIAGIFTYAFVAHLRWGKLASIVAALIVAFSGYMFSLEANYTLVASAAWFPGLLWSFLRLNSNFSYKNMVSLTVCALATFMLITSGRPEIIGPAMFVVTVCILFSLWQSCRRGINSLALNRAGWQMLALLLGALLAAPQIIPTLEWLAISRRSQGLGLHEAFLYSANWYDMLCVFASHPFGDLHLHAAKFLPLAETAPRLIPYLSSAYVGPVALTLALWAIADRQWQARWFYLGALLATIIIALGDQTPIMPLLATAFPVLSFVRFPVKLLYFVVFIIALLAGRGAQAFVDKRVSKFGEWLAALTWLVTLLASVTFFAYSASKVVLLPQTVGMTGELLLEAQGAIVTGMLVASALGLFTCLLARLSNKLNQPAAVSTIVCLLFATMFCAAYEFDRHETARDFFTRPSYVNDRLTKLFRHEVVLSPRIAQTYLELFTCPPWLVAGKPHPATANWYEYSRQVLKPSTNMDFNMPTIFGYEGSMVGDYFDLYLSCYLKSSQNPHPDPCEFKYREYTDVPFARLCQVTGSQFAVTQKFIFRAPGGKPEHVANLDAKFFQLVLDDAAMNVRIYRVLHSKPRIHLSPGWQACQSHEDALKQMQRVDNSSTDLQPMVLIEGFDGQIPAPANLENGMCNIVLDNDLPEHLSLKVESNFPGWLVVADQYYPGWQATVDGKSVKIYRANAVQRAVLLSAGSHRVEFKYKPESLLWGAYLAIFALFILVALIIMAIIKEKRAKTNE